MNESRVAWILRADGIFNMVSGLILQFYIKPILGLIGWPETDTPIYATVLGSALIGLSLAVIFAANKPQQHRTTILSSIIAKSLAGVSILNTLFVLRTFAPNPVLLLAAVGVQVLFVLGEVAYLLSSARSAQSETGTPMVHRA